MEITYLFKFHDHICAILIKHEYRSVQFAELADTAERPISPCPDYPPVQILSSPKHHARLQPSLHLSGKAQQTWQNSQLSTHPTWTRRRRNISRNSHSLKLPVPLCHSLPKRHALRASPYRVRGILDVRTIDILVVMCQD